MIRPQSSTKLSVFLSGIFFILFMAGIMVLLMFKKDINIYLSDSIKSHSSEDIKSKTAVFLDSAFNYQTNKEKFSYTFLEFGSQGCAACKKMESVMQEISNSRKDINVVFLNILDDKNLNLMKYFGITTIPSQVLLDKNGKSFYIHNGYISSEELNEKFN